MEERLSKTTRNSRHLARTFIFKHASGRDFISDAANRDIDATFTNDRSKLSAAAICVDLGSFAAFLLLSTGDDHGCPLLPSKVTKETPLGKRWQRRPSTGTGGGGRGRRLKAANQLRVNRTALPFSYRTSLLSLSLCPATDSKSNYESSWASAHLSKAFTWNVGRGVPLRTQARTLVCTAKEYFLQEKLTMGHSYPLPKLHNELQRPWA
ncbi:hypothetical protein J6590_010772 [Homalodisca vitripennis]|nr:hypothetical protein J6590_010772 [Homalodisca vitripennis]